PIYGYAPRGERLHLPVPRNRGPNTTVLCSMTADGPIAGRGRGYHRSGLRGLCGTGSRAESRIRTDSAHGQPRGAHRPRRIRELIEGRSCELLYLPAYSPDYKWDEKAEIELH
ncbi:MAG: transposase, partial [Actinobacteria bacterium]|nr:transposase [Actinomycetota bacterium]